MLGLVLLAFGLLRLVTLLRVFLVGLLLLVRLLGLSARRLLVLLLLLLERLEQSMRPLRILDRRSVSRLRHRRVPERTVTPLQGVDEVHTILGGPGTGRARTARLGRVLERFLKPWSECDHHGPAAIEAAGMRGLRVHGAQAVQELKCLRRKPSVQLLHRGVVGAACREGGTEGVHPLCFRQRRQWIRAQFTTWVLDEPGIDVVHHGRCWLCGVVLRKDQSIHGPQH